MKLETESAVMIRLLVKQFVDKLVVPKIKLFSDWCEERYNGYLIPTAEHFQDYLERSYNKYSVINTLVFHNTQRELKDIYVAQSLVTNFLFDSVGKETIKVDRLPIDMIKKYEKILISDTAGMGKSTMLKYMFIDLIDNCLSDVGIPIYIELDKLNKSHNILQEIHEKLNSLSKDIDEDLLLQLFQTGGFIFFLDGYDEISLADKDMVTRDILHFISKASKDNYFILTSRPEGSLASFVDFKSFSIQPLTSEYASELLSKYDLSNKKELSGKLIELLKSGQYDALNEYLVNPLLVSLLFTAYDYNRSIPFEKHRFIEQVFEAYFNKHDNTKPIKNRQKHSKLNFDGFDRILRYVGYDCLIRTGVRFNKDTILNIIRDAKEFCGISDFSENAFLEDLVSTVPLFSREGNEYKWVYESLLEYFAARFIYCDTKENQDRILTAIYHSKDISKYLSIMDLYCDIDYKGFTQNFNLPFCKEFTEFRHKNIIKEERINQKFFEERIGLLYAGIQGFKICKLDENFVYPSDINTDIIYSSTIGKDKDYYLFIYGNANKFRLFEFMRNKQPFLFLCSQTKHNYKVFNNVNSLFNILKPNHCYYLDMNLGINDQETYNNINLLMQPISWQNTINYEACESEIKKIELLRANKSDLDLLSWDI